MLDKIIKLLYSSLFLFTPLLMVAFTSELFEFNKLIFIYFIALTVLFVWILKMILNQKIIIKKTPFDLPILIFFLSQVLSTLFSIDPHTSLFGYYGRFNGGLLSLTAYLILYYGFVSNFSYFSESMYLLVNKILKISLISSFLVMLWGLPGKLGYDLSCFLFMGQLNNGCWTDQFRPAERMFSTLGQPNWLGAYLAINFFFALYFYLSNYLNKDNQNNKNFIYFAYLILNFSSVLFTRSRSALFAVIAGITLVIIYLLYMLKNNFTQIKNITKPGILIFVLFITVAVFKTGIQKIDKFITLSTYYNATKSTSQVDSGLIEQSKDNLNSVKIFRSDVTTSGDIRKIVWKGAVDLGLKYPLLGSGVETFAYSYYFVRPKEHNLTSEWDYLYNKAHNEYLNYFATTGFVGLAAYLFLIISIFLFVFKFIRHSGKSRLNRDASRIDSGQARMTEQVREHEVLIIYLLISYLTILITNFFGFSTTTINLFFYLISAFLVSINQLNSYKHSTSIKIIWQQKILIFILLTAYLFLLTSLSRYYLADIKYAKGDSYFKTGEYQQAGQLLNEAYKLQSDHIYEDKLSYVLANISLIASYEKKDDLVKKMRDFSEELNQKSLRASSKNVLYWKTRAKNYYVFYQISLSDKDLKTAIQALEQAKTLSPTDPKIYYSLAIFYSLLEEETKITSEKTQYNVLSLHEINESINMKPNYRDGYLLKGQLLKKAGRNDDARKAFNFILQNLNPNDDEAKKELKLL